MARSYGDRMGEMYTQLGLPKLAEFNYQFSGGGKFICQRAVRHSYTPFVTDLFLLENSKSNSEVTKRIKRNAIYTRALVQQSILNGKYFGKATSLNQNCQFINCQFIDLYPYHSWKFGCLPLEKMLSNSLKCFLFAENSARKAN